MSICLAYWIRCPCCDLDGKVRGRKCQACDGWGILHEELPPKPVNLLMRPRQADLFGSPTINSIPQQK